MQPRLFLCIDRDSDLMVVVNKRNWGAVEKVRHLLWLVVLMPLLLGRRGRSLSFLCRSWGNKRKLLKFHNIVFAKPEGPKLFFLLLTSKFIHFQKKRLLCSEFSFCWNFGNRKIVQVEWKLGYYFYYNNILNKCLETITFNEAILFWLYFYRSLYLIVFSKWRNDCLAIFYTPRSVYHEHDTRTKNYLDNIKCL